VAQGLATFGLAGERAAAQAPGPGSLRWQIVDQLALLDEATVLAGVKIA
jgi:hydroxyethylthiazole kinase-like sugar kinase family protein